MCCMKLVTPLQCMFDLDNISMSLISGFPNVSGRPIALRTFDFGACDPAYILEECWPVICSSSLSPKSLSDPDWLRSLVSLLSSLSESLWSMLDFDSRRDFFDTSSVRPATSFFSVGRSCWTCSWNLCILTADEGVKTRKSGSQNTRDGNYLLSILVSRL